MKNRIIASVVIGIFSIPLIANSVFAGNEFKIEIERNESEVISERYNFPDSREYNIQSTADNIEIEVCNNGLGCKNYGQAGTTSEDDFWQTYEIGKESSRIRLGAIVHIRIPPGKGKVRISIWE